MSSNRITAFADTSSSGVTSKIIPVFLLVVSIVSLATLAITIAVVVQVYKDQSTDDSSDQITTVAPTTPPASTVTTTVAVPLSLAARMKVDDVMDHLVELQRIADTTGGSRAVNRPGFNRTLVYIQDVLARRTNFKVQTTFFNLRNYLPGSNHTFITSINGVETSRLFSTNSTVADFFIVQYTRSANIASFQSITVIPNLGCERSDWESVTVTGNIVLVKRGVCTFLEKAAFAQEYGASVLMFYNDGIDSNRFDPILVNLGPDNELPALFLSFNLGNELAMAAQNSMTNTRVKITINILDESRYPVGNICADTLEGDQTKTIVIGAHSDSVSGGPGIDDNGSGSAAILSMATTLYALYQDNNYQKYPYRVRFCWWGAEELGLLGSRDHVRLASLSTQEGERLSDYLVNLNYDMLGSPNFMLGIYDAKTAPPSTPSSTLPGCQRTTDLYVEWFRSQGLPWDYTDFSGRSDYGPFLQQGIVAGGLFTGADGTKTLEERDRYAKVLGPLLGGVANAIHDPCYHQACDSLGNINKFALEKTTQAGAYVLEQMGRNPDLTNWLYPNGRPILRKEDQAIYDPIAEYFYLPYS